VWHALVEMLAAWGLTEADLAGWLVAGARVLPAVVLIPALGFGIASTAVRVCLGLALAASVAPALTPAAIDGGLGPAVVRGVLSGLPVALVASAGLWAAWMAGGVIDALAGGDGHAPGGGWGLLLGLLASIAFLEAGGATAVAERLVAAPAGIEPMRAAADALARGIGIAVWMATPVVIVFLFLQVIGLFVLRADPRGVLVPVLELCRPLLLLFGIALVLERVAELAIVLRP
jgi:type III secretory pathway component EscT